MKTNVLARMLVKNGIVDQCAIEDPLGYDDGETMDRIARLAAFLDIVEPPTIHADPEPEERSKGPV